jgi:hypothetical protein
MRQKIKLPVLQLQNILRLPARIVDWNIAYTHDRNIAIQELKHESIYTLLIIDSKETLTHYTEKLPTRFIRDLLSDAQCPVLIVPKKI